MNLGYTPKSLFNKFKLTNLEDLDLSKLAEDFFQFLQDEDIPENDKKELLVLMKNEGLPTSSEEDLLEFLVNMGSPGAASLKDSDKSNDEESLSTRKVDEQGVPDVVPSEVLKVF